MVRILNTLSGSAVKFWNDEEGATAAEYGLIVALIAAAMIAALKLFGTDLSAMFNNLATKISANG